MSEPGYRLVRLPKRARRVVGLPKPRKRPRPVDPLDRPANCMEFMPKKEE